MTPFDTYKLLYELTKEQPSTGLGLPSDISKSDPVNNKQWMFTEHQRTLEFGGTFATRYAYNFDVLLHFWYCHMDCDPWSFDWPELE
jgi:hypothetical protein